MVSDRRRHRSHHAYVFTMTLRESETCGSCAAIHRIIQVASSADITRTTAHNVEELYDYQSWQEQYASVMSMSGDLELN